MDDKSGLKTGFFLFACAQKQKQKMRKKRMNPIFMAKTAEKIENITQIMK